MLGEPRAMRLVRTDVEVDRLLIRSSAAADRAERARNRGDVEAVRRAFVETSDVLDDVDRRRVQGESGDASGVPGTDAALDHVWETALANYERAGAAMTHACMLSQSSRWERRRRRSCGQ